MITEQTIIGDIVDNYPELVEPLKSFGVQCVGCHASPYEPLGDGLRGHGMSDDDVKQAVIKLNASIQPKVETKQETGTLKITDSAALKIKEICTSKGKAALRITVKAGGCSGYEYAFALDDTKNDDDVVIEYNGATVYTNPASLSKMAGAQIDYIDALTGAGFKISNPQATSTCGCGSSFA